MYADLHIHTTASDGTFTPAEIVRLARDIGLTIIALTDHDTVSGLQEGISAGQNMGVEVLPGVEINTDYKGKEVHVLGYLFDRQHPEFLNTLQQLRESRITRMRKMIDRLREIGLEIDPARVAEIAGSGSLGRPHLARAMEEKGYVTSVRDAFDRYLGVGGPGYVPRYKITPQEAVRLILTAKGIPVLAHPGLIGDDSLIDELLPAGLMGLEVYHSDHDDEATERYYQMAKERGLLITGGSDFHGQATKAANLLGKVKIPVQLVEKLKETQCTRFEARG